MSPDTGSTRKEGPPHGTERWKAETKAIERVIDVVLTLDRPQTAGTIADEAMVSERTAREHLDLLAELSIVTATTARNVTRYRPDAAYLRFKSVSSLVEEYTRDELLDHSDWLRTRIEETKERFEADTPDELRSKVASEEVPVEEVAECRKAASEWDAYRHELDVLEEALKRYDEFDRGEVTA